MCYSKEYSSSDGIPEFFRTGETSQLAACKTSYHMAGGSRKASATAKAKAKRAKSKKRRVRRKKI